MDAACSAADVDPRRTHQSVKGEARPTWIDSRIRFGSSTTISEGVVDPQRAFGPKT